MIPTHDHTPTDPADAGRPSLATLDDALLADGVRTPRLRTPSRRSVLGWLAGLGGIVALSACAAALAAAQEARLAAVGIGVVGGLAATAWAWWGVFRTGSPAPGRATAGLMAIVGGAAGIGEALARDGDRWAGVIAIAAGAIAATWWTWRQFHAAPRNRTAAAVLSAVTGATLMAWQMQRHGWTGAAIAVAGVSVLTLLLFTGQAALRRLLDVPDGICGVARVIVDEAVRTRATLVLVVIVLVSLPSLPLVLDGRERLAYRIQFFLDWALGGATFLLAMMTIFLVCGSVTGDIDSRRIHMSLVKPLRRWHYLVGKLLGATLVNALLLAIVGVGILTAARVLQSTPAVDPTDRTAVDDQVLTARQSVRPEHPRRADFDRDVDSEIDRMRRDDPAAFAVGEERARERIRAQKVQEWHSVHADIVSSYLFTGLEAARSTTGTVQLRLKPFADNVNVDRADVRFVLFLNDRPHPVESGEHREYTLTSGMVHTLDLPAAAIDMDGRLLVTIANRNLVPAGATRATAISFIPGQGMEMLYRVGSFEGNLVRGILVCWIKLGLVAAAAIAASSWLGFPTAVLTSLGIFAMASASAFLGHSLDIYTGADAADAGVLQMLFERLYHLTKALGEWRLWTAVKVVTSSIGEAVLMVVPSLGRYDAVNLVATGRVVSLADLGSCLVEVGLAGVGVLGIVAASLFHGRDLVAVGD